MATANGLLNKEGAEITLRHVSPQHGTRHFAFNPVIGVFTMIANHTYNYRVSGPY